MTIMKNTDYILMGIGVVLLVIATEIFLLWSSISKIEKSSSYIADYLYRGWTMYENQVIMIDKLFEMANTLDDIKSQEEEIYYNMY